jgi:L-asparaginase
MSTKSILVVYAGGTIGMVPGPRGLAPSESFASRIGDWIAAEPTLAGVNCHVIACDPLIDSADANPSSWHHLAGIIWEKRETFDAVVILHGTDTLSHTASALSFLLSDFNKPIVLTGAQIPFAAESSDAKMNFIGALHSAAADIREVCIFFDGVLLRGNRTRKWGTRRGESFISAHWPAMGRFDGDLQISDTALLPASAAPRMSAPRKLPAGSAGLLTVFPGFGADLLLASADAYPAGLVLELYGAGTGPTESMCKALKRITGKGIVIIGVSRCVRGVLEPHLYENGRLLADCGVANGHDLTPEAAMTKLHWLWCESRGREDASALIAKSIAGELTRRQGLDPGIG